MTADWAAHGMAGHSDIRRGNSQWATLRRVAISDFNGPPAALPPRLSISGSPVFDRVGGGGGVFTETGSKAEDIACPRGFGCGRTAGRPISVAACDTGVLIRRFRLLQPAR
ncbi:hypothetical protein [Williamsia muralis]|uniref:hypothetical protein n=1 Tax=Williamsia marianensis TaxID=85044 RepID=UPI001058277B|nr:hypothetical protein [Williamsia marianensis]